MRTRKAQYYLSMIECILEGKKVYLEKDVTAKLLALYLGIKHNRLERAVAATVGLSLDNMIDMFRVVYARALLKNGTAYEDLWHLSGFGSLEHMESAFECIVV